jgi:GAF domain-containing protein/methyl-accepting chemotaxis protein
MTMPSNRSTAMQNADERLAQTFFASGRYNSLILGVTAIGFIVIYLLTNFNILGDPAPQLLYISGAVFLLALFQIIVLGFARRQRGIAANFLGTLSVIIFVILLTGFWEGMVIPALVIALITPISSVYAGMPGKYYGGLALLIIAGVAGILFANASPFIVRLPFSTTASIASLAFLATIGLLLVTVAFIARSRRYRSLRTQLLVSFMIIVTIPTVLATVLSAVGAYVNNETQVFNSLETISNLKENQINQVVDSLQASAARINQDSEFYRNALNLLTPGGTGNATLEIYRTFARNRLQSIVRSEQANYNEIMVLNLRGDAILSTDASREGRNYQTELFYREGSIGNYTGFSKNPLFGDFNLVHAAPIYDTDGSVLRGILVIRANARLIKDIVENTPGFEQMESYLLDRNYSPVTRTRAITQVVRTVASETLVSNATISAGEARYETYTGEVVLGRYQRIETLDLIYIAEVPRAFIIGSSINSLLSSTALALFAIAIAIVAVVISAESISNPIGALAKTAADFAAGNLSARANIERRDEIGSLGNAYDQMAEQLQDIIGKLEQRVTDRTQALEDQTVRLRTAAEIARDAASLHKLDELLARAGVLILERFGYSHTGIFLLDNNLEYAVLASSPTEAGRQMIANNHKLRVGEAGIVGRVALTGEPRIALDTGADRAFFNNPYLPDTRSELALPLKVENRIIGVLDVQSDKPEAFNDEDIAIMQVLADQLATAIERTRLLQQVEQNLSDLERAYGQFTQASWKSLSESGLLSRTGYRFDNVRIQPISELPELGDEAIQTGARVMSANGRNPTGKNQVAIPIKLRGQTIGVVSATLKDGYTSNTIATLELAIERLALSLESARLYEEARLRADREQMIAQVTTSISSATEFDAILRTTVEEIGKLLGDTEVGIQVVSGTDGNQPE